jgi:hypothetical protein
MSTVAQPDTFRNPVSHYATWHDISGIATLRQGGYIFAPENGANVFLVSYKDQDLHLHGRADLADAQHALDIARER